MKSLKDRRKLLNLKNFNRCLCFGNPKSKEYDPEFCKHCRKSDIFSDVDNKKCGLTDFILFNNSVESDNYASIVTDKCFVLNYVDNIDDFKKLNDYFGVYYISNIIDNLYDLLIENFDKKLINKYIGFAITNTNIESNLVLYLYNKLDNRDYEEFEDDTCINSLHNVLIFNFGDFFDDIYNIDEDTEEGDVVKPPIKIKFAKEYTDEDTFDTCYKYSKTYSNYNPNIVLKYITKLLDLNNDNDIKKEIRCYYYKLK